MARLNLQWGLVLRAGAIAGLVEVVAGIVMYLSGVYFASWSGPVSLLVLAGSIALAQKWYSARTAPQPMGYALAFVVGIIVAAMTAAIYVAYNFISVSFVYPHFIEQMIDARFAQQHLSGMSQQQANELLTRLRAETTLSAVAAANFRFLAVMGTAIAALLAAFTRRMPVVLSKSNGTHP
jgi:Protein of unknown function (DUF4199)